MMHNLELNVGVEKETKKGGKSEQGAAQAAAANKFLSAARLKESFNLSFDALFLDMFTEVPVAKSERIERPRETVRIERPASVERPRTETESAGNQNVLDARPVERPREARADESANEAGEETRVESEAQESGEVDESSRTDARPVELADEADEPRKLEGIQTSIRMIRVELTAKFQQALSSDQIADLKAKIEKLLEDDTLDIQQLLAGTLGIVADLVGPRQAVETVDAGPDMAGDAFRKFLKRFLKEMSAALNDAGPAQQLEANTPEARVIEQKVDDALSKLVQKMDRKVTDADQALAGELLKSNASDERDESRAADEKPQEIAKPAEVKREYTRLQILETRFEQKFQVQAAQDAIDASLSDIPKIRTKAPLQVVAGTQSGVGAVGEAGRAGRSSEGQHQPWQNSYNQNSSQKNLGESARTGKGQDAARPQQQNPIFDQIVQNAKITVTEGRGVATIHLKPEMLGKVEMKVIVEDGKVSVRFVAENQSVRAAILENVNELKKSLAETGLEVEQVTVLLSGDFAGQDQNPERETGENASPRGARGLIGDDEDEEAEFEEVRRVISDGSTIRYVA
jgi:flagellar hook-length control protein FliK